MKMRWLTALAILVVVVLGMGMTWWWLRPAPLRFVTTTAGKGNIERFVVTTGNVNPVVTVQVGTYASGPIQAIYCDYETKVKAGQLCAKIDPKTFQVAVDQAKANLASARAQLAKDQANLTYAQITYKRDLELLKHSGVSKAAMDIDRNARDQAAAQIKLDQATILQRQADLEGAQVNLDYTNIVSPVDGVVVSRNVNVGQTVAASFQTPTLFVIAQDLTKMQVDTNVSESDIGVVDVGQLATFTVDAYPGKKFEGEVTQVRKSPITVQNVVTYDAVISVANPKLLLFPGMTANARIITEQRKNVLKVPLQALQFSPYGLTASSPAAPADRVWVLRDDQPVSVPVTVGLKGANSAEVTGGGLKAGDTLILGEISASAGGTNQPARSPFGLR
ncbi:MAG: efflux RND transporter periplasmic adaptor subunit [Salinisphaera sp.]|uniref:efflux RND transporter periplasmic adaptor subunit n=1 Tax=Salinisphaera sp. TaxID=1914330 RepID=UPI003C7C534E